MRIEPFQIVKNFRRKIEKKDKPKKKRIIPEMIIQTRNMRNRHRDFGKLNNVTIIPDPQEKLEMPFGNEQDYY